MSSPAAAPAPASPAAPGPFTRSMRAFLLAPPAWLILALGAVILFLRRPDQFTNPQLWAEDGIFFFQARVIGLPAFGLELAGYFGLAPRTVAALAAAVDPAWVPHVFAGAAVVLTLYVMSRVLSARCPLPLRPACALALVLVPDASEALVNSSNIHWVFTAGFIVLLASADPSRPRQWLHDAAALIYFGLSGPFSILFTPFFAWRYFQRRTRASLVLLLLVAVCALVQAITMITHPQPPPPAAVFDPRAAAAFPGLRILAGLLVGPVAPANIPWWAGALLTALLFIVIAVLALRLDRTCRPLGRILALAFAALLVSTLARTWPAMPLLCQPDSASRYIYPLQLLLLWLLLATARDPSRPFRLACLTLVLVALAANHSRFRIPPVPDKQWSRYVPQLRAGAEVTVPINPEGWEFPFPARRP